MQGHSSVTIFGVQAGPLLGSRVVVLHPAPNRAGERREQSQIPGRAQPRAVPAQGPPGRRPPPARPRRPPWLGLQSAGRPAAPSGRPTSTLQLRLRPESLAGSEDRPARRRQRSSGAVHPADGTRRAQLSARGRRRRPRPRFPPTCRGDHEAEQAERFPRPRAPRRRPGPRRGRSATWRREGAGSRGVTSSPSGRGTRRAGGRAGGVCPGPRPPFTGKRGVRRGRMQARPPADLGALRAPTPGPPPSPAPGSRPDRGHGRGHASGLL